MERHESLVDAALRLARYAPGFIRRPAGRRAAARGLSRSALRAAPADPVVLARLGLHLQAREADGGGRRGAAARAASAAVLGDLAPVRALLSERAPLGAEEQRLLARCIAPSAPELAEQILPREDILARAACALAASDARRAEGLLRLVRPSRESRVIEAAAAAELGDWPRSRYALNAAFTIDGCMAPLHEGRAEAITLAAFGEAPSDARAIDGPLISIVVPAHQAAATLALSVGSLLRQTWRHLEVVIVDDRSSDATGEIADDLSRIDDRVRVLSNDRAAGAFGARNRGAAAARGDFLAFHDADDWAHPQRLERQLASLAGEQALSVARYFRLDESGKPVSPRVFPLVRFTPIGLLMRAEAWRTLGPFEEAPVGADSEWLSRFDERFGRRAAARLGAIGLVARWAPGSLSASPSTGMRGAGLERRLTYERDWRWRQAGLERRGDSATEPSAGLAPSSAAR